ncbi:hypothetical protein [Streptomyces sp. NPDC059743]|uniref:hypothetical protein n=1 Tax=Streptomyces sp. NPDC059743 TaxID=3346928 RepID=UPI00364797F7
MMKTGAEAEAEMRAVRKRYDEWTWKAAEELNRRFSDREIAGQLRAGRYRAILTAPLDEARLMMYVEIAELQGYFRSVANRVRAMRERYGRAGAVRYAVLDTNTTLHFTRFDKVPWQRVLGKGTAVMVPHVVVDEIDAKSYQTGDRKISRTKWRPQPLRGSAITPGKPPLAADRRDLAPSGRGLVPFSS